MYHLPNCPYKIEIVGKKSLKYPPTKNRASNTKAPFDSKEIIKIKTNLVSVPTIMTSDLHSASYRRPKVYKCI